MGITYNAGTNTVTVTGTYSNNLCSSILAADVAGGWGVTFNNANQYYLNANLEIGDGSTTTPCSDTAVHFQVGATGNLKTFQVRNKATLTFTNSSITVFHTTSYSYIFNGGAVILTNCYFRSNLNTGWLVESGASITATNTSIDNIRWALASTNTLTRVNIVNSSSVFYILTAIGTYSDVVFAGILYADGGSTTTGRTVTVNNSVFNGSSLGEFWCGSGHLYLNLINCTAANWTFINDGGSYGWWVYRKQTFDVATNPSATVTLKDNAGNTVFSVTSDGTSGAIAQQTVTRGYYAEATGNTLQDYGPFTLTISKAGYVTYTHTGIVLDEKIDWRISLLTTAEAQALVPSRGGRGIIKYVDREVIKKVEVPTKKEKIALQLCGVLIAQKENMRRQNGE